MRVLMSFLLLLALGVAWAQDPGDEPKAEGEKPAEEKAEEEEAPKEPPAWGLPDKSKRKFEKELRNYLVPGKKKRPEMLHKLEKTMAKAIDGHSALEDVTTFVGFANNARTFNPKLSSKRGKFQEVKIAPETHGFPGGIGTVLYTLYLPKKYSDKKLWPVIFALPDNKKWSKAEDYIKSAWLKSKDVAEQYIIAVPKPQSKGDAWTRRKSLARAMISLRHLMGTFDADKKTAGPATDMLRVILDGDDSAALIGARFSEVFAGVVLRHAEGKTGGGPNLRQIGGLSGMPAYCLIDPKKKYQKQFGKKLRDGNSATLVIESADPMGEADAVAAWLKKMPVRNTQPRTIEYTVHQSSFQRHYWINVLDYDAAFKPAPWFEATADRAKNEVRVQLEGITKFNLFLNDALVDLNRPIKIVVVEEEREYEFFADKAERDLGQMLTELVSTNHPWRVYPVKFAVDVGRLRSAWDAEQEKKKAEEEKTAKDDSAGTKNSSYDGQAMGK